MKNRNFVIVLIFVLAAGGAAWWFLQSPAPAPEPVKTAAAPKPAEAPKPAPVKSITQVAAPIAPPVVAPAAKPAVAAQPAPAQPATGVQAELNAAIDDMTTMMQSGDMVGMMKKYMSPERLAQIPPEQLAQMEQVMQQQAQSPQMQQMFQAMSQSFAALKDQTPEMNAAGDQATYQMAIPASILPPGMAAPPPRPVTFQKVDGQWYINGPAGGAF